MQKKAILIDKKDNVATALGELAKGDSVEVGIEDYTMNTKLLQDALKDIGQGEAVTKYGEAIGLATKQIRQGEHVHVHNVESQKGRGDKR
jgi:altronate dehydratase small subunit